MVNQPQKFLIQESPFTYIKYAEFFDPPSPPKAKPYSRKKTTRGGVPKPSTLDALNRVCQIRLKAIKNRASIPTIVGASQEAGTSFKTIQTYMPELLEKWRDENYRPEKLELLE